MKKTQMVPIILKLGGSVITDKRAGRPVVQTSQIQRLAREVARATRAPLILLYGAGSFGHPLAHKHRLSGRVLSRGSLVGMGETVSSVRALGGVLATLFLKEGIPVVPLQTSSFVRQEKGKLVVTNYPLIEDILAHGGVPLFGGDVIIADRRRTTIVSADALVAELTRHFHSQKLFFATDVDGVYKTFPARVGEYPLPVMSRKELQAMLAVSTIRKSARDVTGAMTGKLHSLLPLRNCTITICNGLRRGALASALRGGAAGTRITL